VEEVEKVTLNLRAGDFQKLKDLCGRHGASKVIRELVSYYLDLTAEGRSEVDTRIAERGKSRIMEAPTSAIATATLARANDRRRNG
jgi:hypothetical protein